MGREEDWKNSTVRQIVEKYKEARIIKATGWAQEYWDEKLSVILEQADKHDKKAQTMKKLLISNEYDRKK